MNTRQRWVKAALWAIVGFVIFSLQRREDAAAAS